MAWILTIATLDKRFLFDSLVVNDWRVAFVLRNTYVWQLSSYLIACSRFTGRVKWPTGGEEQNYAQGTTSGRKSDNVLDCFTENKADSTENCQGPALGLISHLVQSPNVRSELSCTTLHGWILLELTINNEPQTLFFHLAFPADLRNVREAPRNYVQWTIRLMVYEAHKRISFY